MYLHLFNRNFRSKTTPKSGKLGIREHFTQFTLSATGFACESPDPLILNPPRCWDLPAITVRSIDVDPKLHKELDNVGMPGADGVVQGSDALVIGLAGVLHLTCGWGAHLAKVYITDLSHQPW